MNPNTAIADVKSEDSARADYYRRLLRWYPASWRERNAEVAIGVLLDDDDAAGRTVPPSSTRWSLIGGGLVERFVAPQQATVFSRVVLITATLFLLWYASAGTWSPGVHTVSSVGAFSNPVPLLTVFYIAASVLAFVDRARTARLLVGIATGMAVVFGVLASIFGWQGPSWPLVVILIGFGLLASLPLVRRRDILLAGAAWVFAIFGTAAIDYAVSAGGTLATSPPKLISSIVALASFVVVTILVAPIFIRDTQAESAAADTRPV